VGRRIVLGVVGAVAAAVCAFVIVVLVRGGLAEAGLWAGVAGGLAGVVGAAVTVGLAVPRHAVPPDPQLPGPVPDLPVIGALTEHYTTLDRYFCAFAGETFPNRFYQHAGQTDRDHDSEVASVLPTI
jgi:Phosphoesterase family